MKQRILAILLSLTMMFTLVPTAWAADEMQQDDTEAQETETPAEPAMNGNCGAASSENSVKWALTKNNEDSSNPTYTLTISGNGAMAGYTANINNGKATQPWRASKTGVEIEKITKVVVSKGVTSIGAFAFNGLTAVSEYDIGADVSTIS